MSKQAQEVGNNSIAVQSSGDTSIRVGFHAAEVQSIIHSAMQAAMSLFAVAAREVADERMADLEHRIMERFSTQEATSVETLKQPDFQYVLTRAHHSYARSGDSQVADTLVDLIGHRASQTERNRLSLTLNDAIDKAPLLTKNEFAELSLIYMLGHTRRMDIINFERFVEWIKTFIMPFVSDVAEHGASFQYMEAQSCGQTSVMQTQFRDLFVKNYGGVLSKGFDRAQYIAHVAPELHYTFEKTEIVIPCLHDGSRWQLNAIDRKTFLEHAAEVIPDEATRNNLWNMFENTVFNEDELVEKVSEQEPQFCRLRTLWNSTPLNSFRLTAVGIAIGHANARRVAKIDADLAIWIH
jgi:hypothetical protein